MNGPAAVRRQIAQALLGVLLLWSQALAIQHGLSHAVDSAERAALACAAGAPHQPASQHCVECDGLIAFDAMLAAGPLALSWPAVFAVAPHVASLSAAPRAAELRSYRSRAPPIKA